MIFLLEDMFPSRNGTRNTVSLLTANCMPMIISLRLAEHYQYAGSDIFSEAFGSELDRRYLMRSNIVVSVLYDIQPHHMTSPVVRRL